MERVGRILYEIYRSAFDPQQELIYAEISLIFLLHALFDKEGMKDYVIQLKK